MSNNDYFTVAYKILKYLQYCYENGLGPDPNILQARTFAISNHQFYQTLSMLTDDGYIKGLTRTSTKSGDIWTGLDQLSITSSGLQYLAENNMMKKACKTFKEVRDWLPFV